MLGLDSHLEAYLFLEATDMRKSFDTLAALAKGAGFDPVSGKLFVFAGKRRDRVKVLYWSRGGYYLLSRRLESGTFSVPIPELGEGVVLEIDAVELSLLMEGIELSRIRRKKVFEPKKLPEKIDKEIQVTQTI